MPQKICIAGISRKKVFEKGQAVQVRRWPVHRGGSVLGREFQFHRVLYLFYRYDQIAMFRISMIGVKRISDGYILARLVSKRDVKRLKYHAIPVPQPFKSPMINVIFTAPFPETAICCTTI
jgi:hypothetical protein